MTVRGKGHVPNKGQVSGSQAPPPPVPGLGAGVASYHFFFNDSHHCAQQSMLKSPSGSRRPMPWPFCLRRDAHWGSHRAGTQGNLPFPVTQGPRVSSFHPSPAAISPAATPPRAQQPSPPGPHQSPQQANSPILLLVCSVDIRGSGGSLGDEGPPAGLGSSRGRPSAQAAPAAAQASTAGGLTELFSSVPVPVTNVLLLGCCGKGVGAEAEHPRLPMSPNGDALFSSPLRPPGTLPSALKLPKQSRGPGLTGKRPLCGAFPGTRVAFNLYK